ncbi:MAG: S-methyl-5'-thioadenosine phosphorylase [Clostridiales bacterium]|nr:S-methyl-5'-thioadenosine phosphorylase [Clostridiales bacterium]MCF8022598.1 S-methyl-5'-thioadenosine phosphorylase [Clostridiales bacterium]
MTISIGIIGGSGVYDPSILDEVEEREVGTQWGAVKVKIGSYKGKKIAFMARHGEDHSVPPHLVNYRANIMALKQLGVKSIFATAAVGSLNKGMQPGDFVFIDQFIDFTKSRPQTFVEDGVVHLDLTEPYCPELRAILGKCARKLDLSYHARGNYVCAEGPRFETPAEVRMFAKLGGDLAGMTSVPEVILAREAQMCYAAIAMVTNFGAGISANKLSHQEVLDIMNENVEKLRSLIMLAVESTGDERACQCQEPPEIL